MTATPTVTTTATMAPGDLDLVGIERRFGTTTALAGIDLHIPAGSLTVVVGPSGCGKTTLLRILAGLDTPDAGRLLVGGADVGAVPVDRRGVALVFQDYALFPHLSVERNISFGLRLQRRHDRRNGPGPAEIVARTREVAELFDLVPLLTRRPAQLSGGQRQRVALARAVVRRPQVLLLDEPMSALDVALRASARAEIQRLHRELGTTLVLVTHDQHEALSLATHLVVMDQGRVVQAAAPREVYRRPADVFVAGFVGHPRMNLWQRPEGTVGAAGAVGTVGWRPGDLRPGPGGAADLPVVGTVEFTEFTGAGQEVHCRGAAGPFALVQHDGQAWLEVGDPVQGHVPAAAVHHFAADGTRRDG